MLMCRLLLDFANERFIVHLVLNTGYRKLLQCFLVFYDDLEACDELE